MFSVTMLRVSPDTGFSSAAVIVPAANAARRTSGRNLILPTAQSRDELAEDAQATHAAVGVNRQAHVRDGAEIRELAEHVPRIRPQLRFRQQHGPAMALGDDAVHVVR